MKPLRALLPYLTIGVVLAAIYAGWTVYSRWNAHREEERAAKAAEAEADKKIVDEYGGGKLKILAFYASPGAVKPGGRALVCYGVANAKSVAIEPHIDDIAPSLSRCIEAFPRRTTEYKLIATDAKGQTATQSFVLRVD
jgi:hypothetical protein